MRWMMIFLVAAGITTSSLGVVWGSDASVTLQPDAAGPVVADTDSFNFDSYTVDYTLRQNPDGTTSLDTVETFVAEFPDFDQNKGIIRAIPDYYNRVPIDTYVTGVEDENGDGVNYTTDTDDGFTVLALGTDEYVRGQQTYTISYSQSNVVAPSEDNTSQVFYWDTNGVGFPQSFNTVTARIHVAPVLSDELTGEAFCYFGPQGSTDECDIEQTVDASGPLFTATTNFLEANENMTVAIPFKAGTFVIPGATAWVKTIPLVLMGLAALLALAALVLKLASPRSARGRGTIIAQYTAPDNTNMFTAGDVTGRGKYGVLPAQLISLAVNGNAQLLDNDGDGYSLRFLDGEGLDPQEVAFVNAIFARPSNGPLPETGSTVGLVSRGHTLGARLRPVSASTSERVVRLGLRVRLHRRSGRILFFASLAVVAGAGVLVLVNVASPVPTPFPMIALGATAVGAFIVLLLSGRKPTLTEAGVELRDHLRGIEVYLNLAEAERFRMLQSPDGALRIDTADTRQVVKLYEKLLPYAVLWGVEDEWSGQLSALYGSTGPEWYNASTPFDAFRFSTDLRRFSVTAGRTASLSSRTSSGSGSSGGYNGDSSNFRGSGSSSSFGSGGGGGFSGGGGGGGGGGGR